MTFKTVNFSMPWSDKHVYLANWVITSISHYIHILRQAFITYVWPILEYASSVWAPYLLKHINAVEKVQKRFTKSIYSLFHLSYPERLAAINSEPLELCRLKNDLVMHYKCSNNLVALPCDEYVVNSIKFLRLDRVVTDLLLLCAILVIFEKIF